MTEKSFWSKYQKGHTLPNQPILFEAVFQIKGFITNDKYYFRFFPSSIYYFDEKKHDTPLAYCLLDFDICFEVVRIKDKKDNQLGAIKSIIFDKQHHKSEILSNNNQQMIQLREVLRNILNQRGFHEQYKAQKKIGKGNFASVTYQKIVYLADRLEDGQSFAVKAFSKEAAFAQEFGKESLINEIELMRGLNHPNIIRLHEVFETENSLYLILDLYTGGLLYDKMKAKHRFTSEETLNITKGLTLGLYEMHKNNIMHRDLKPENLIFKSAYSTNIAIVDLGLATRTNLKKFMFVRCGTPGFVAPEVINIVDFDLTYSSVCDMFSLGLIFHILLIGKSPFNGKDYNEVLAQNRASNITFNNPECSKIPKVALDLLVKMLQKDPNLRITAEQALQHEYFNQINTEMEIETDGMTEEKMKQYEENYRKRFPTVGSNSPMPSPQILQTKGNKQLQDENGFFKMPNTPVLTGRVDAISYEGFNSPSVQNEERNIVQMGTQGTSPQVKRKSLFGSPNVNFVKRNLQQQQQVGEDCMQEEEEEERKNDGGVQKITKKKKKKFQEKDKKSKTVRNNLRNLGL